MLTKYKKSEKSENSDKMEYIYIVRSREQISGSR